MDAVAVLVFAGGLSCDLLGGSHALILFSRFHLSFISDPRVPELLEVGVYEEHLDGVMACLERRCRDAPGRLLQETPKKKKMDFLSQLEANPICD